MGLIADNNERAEEHWGALEAPRFFAQVAREQHRAPVFPCVACSAEFGSEAALHSHIYASHPRSFYYLRANGAVVNDFVYLPDALTQLEVVPVGAHEVTVGGRWPSGIDVSRTVSVGNVFDLVTVYGPVTAPGEVRIWGRVNGRERLHRINVIAPPDVDLSLADELVAEAQLPLLEGLPAGYEHLRDVATREEDEVVQQYLVGFASYLLGCNLELRRDWHSARLRFEEAYARLRPFASPLARDVRGVLDFRRHQMESLRRRSTTSVWHQAASYFQTPPVIVVGRPIVGAGGIWVDDYQLGLLEAVGQHCSGQPIDALKTVTSLPLANDEEPGNAQKRNLVTARIATALGAGDLARHMYSRLQDDPTYATEALQYS